MSLSFIWIFKIWDILFTDFDYFIFENKRLSLVILKGNFLIVENKSWMESFTFFSKDLFLILQIKTYGKFSSCEHYR